MVLVGDFNFAYIEWECHRAKDIDGAEFVKYFQEIFLRQYVGNGAVERATLDLVKGQMDDVFVN